MKLIFDCGSTKCAIVQQNERGEYHSHEIVRGFNPILHPKISDATYDHFSPFLEKKYHNISHITYGGAGCINDDVNEKVGNGLAHIFPNCQIDVFSDLEFIGNILNINKKSVIAIIGTGSNAGLWDGNKVTKYTLSGGYLLGDEGSAFILGKKVIINFLRENFSPKSQNIIESKLKIKRSIIVQTLYNSTTPNKEIAAYASLLSEINDPLKDKILNESFKDFIQDRILPISNDVSVIHLFGSVVYFNQHRLKQLLEDVNLQLGIISKSPLDMIIN
ncbi:MAG: hypothetical protein V3V00_03185 [Saprospiraceae bacterium]